MDSKAVSPGTMVANALAKAPKIFGVERVFPAPQLRVYEYLCDSDRLHEWIPFVLRSHSDDSAASDLQGVGSIRMIDKGFGPLVQETIHHKNAPQTFAYSARDCDFFGWVTNHLSVIEFEAVDSENCRVSWDAYGEHPGYIRGLLGRTILTLVFTVGLWRAAQKVR